MAITAGSEKPEKAFSRERTPVRERTTGTPSTTISSGRRRIERRTMTKNVSDTTTMIGMELPDERKPAKRLEEGYHFCPVSVLVWTNRRQGEIPGLNAF